MEKENQQKQTSDRKTDYEDQETLEKLERVLEMLSDRVKNLASKNKFSKKVKNRVELDFN